MRDDHIFVELSCNKCTIIIVNIINARYHCHSHWNIWAMRDVKQIKIHVNNIISFFQTLFLFVWFFIKTLNIDVWLFFLSLNILTSTQQCMKIKKKCWSKKRENKIHNKSDNNGMWREHDLSLWTAIIFFSFFFLTLSHTSLEFYSLHDDDDRENYVYDGFGLPTNQPTNNSILHTVIMHAWLENINT